MPIKASGISHIRSMPKDPTAWRRLSPPSVNVATLRSRNTADQVEDHAAQPALRRFDKCFAPGVEKENIAAQKRQRCDACTPKYVCQQRADPRGCTALHDTGFRRKRTDMDVHHEEDADDAGEIDL
ncbi:hypothetical protein [Salipiger abyssi]|uniref:hypothetical protein n=1 Tax=Salipiger abyssi TaxID=1250539 RepID=UPI001A8FA6B4|nr:hypothetical protein [Salipiger abyssi]